MPGRGAPGQLRVWLLWAMPDFSLSFWAVHGQFKQELLLAKQELDRGGLLPLAVEEHAWQKAIFVYLPALRWCVLMCPERVHEGGKCLRIRTAYERGAPCVWILFEGIKS